MAGTIQTRSSVTPGLDVHVPRPVETKQRPFGGDAKELESALRRRIDGEVRFDDGARALYATDHSMYRQVPIGVVAPRTIDDVVATVAECHARGVPILGRGCGSSLAGQCCNVAVVIDFSKYLHRIVAVDPAAHRAIVQPGVICDQLRKAAHEHGLTFGPDPATHRYCTLGGMIGNNSCGVHSVMAGKTVDNSESLDVLLHDGTRLHVGATSETDLERIVREGGRRGEIYARLRALRDRWGPEIRKRFPKIPRRVSGYNLDELLPENGFHVARALVGSESTCVLVLQAEMRLVPFPSHRALLVLGFPDVFQAADAVPAVLSTGCIALEAFHAHVIENMRKKGQHPPGAKLLPEGSTWLLAEYGAEAQRDANGAAELAEQRIRGDARHLSKKVIEDADEQELVWDIRESGVAASRVPHAEDALPSWEDAAVAPERLGAYLRDFDALVERFGYAYSIYGHFGDGCAHTRITFDPKTPEGVKKYRAFMESAADLVVRHGGSLSGEHGDGQARGELLPKMFGSEIMQAFREFKAIWDPHEHMNPGKIVDAYPLDSNLRTGPDYRPKRVLTQFQFPEDHGSFALAAERCFGIGKCRGLDGGTMCPSFMATREEMHSTRGRAHMLFELLRGDVLRDGFRDEHVKEALDLCLACKGCKHDCPVNVDIATYKAEFLSHHYEGRLRPMVAYALGLVRTWARIASLAPTLANSFLALPGVEWIGQKLFGLAVERRVPRFAPETFRAWFAARTHDRVKAPRGRVMLFADTFDEHFTPSIAKAAVEVLEWAGYEVDVPRRALCCGRPYYDFGMLDRARRALAEILDALRPALRDGTRIVVLEPSCASVFRDELPNLMADDEDAHRLAAQTVLLSELFVRDGVKPPALHARALVHGHCHHKSVLGFDSEAKVLADAGIDAEVLDSGCCGLAGSFGFEAEKYPVSMAIGEQRLLPAVRDASPGAIVVADGFSCREQIAHGTERRALHLAQVLQMAIHEGPATREPYPERRWAEPEADASPVPALVAIGIGTATVVLACALRRSRR